MTTMDDETLRAMLDGLRHGPVHITADRCQGDSRAVNAFCDLIKAAPALAAEVLRLRAEIERRDADDAESECREIERHQRMCAALDIPEEDRAYATDEEVEAAAIDAVCERDALAAEVLRLRERAERDEAERDEAEREVLHLRSERDEHAHKAGEWEESHDIELARAEMVEAAARAHLAADDALTLARRTDAADVPAAEARADAARECLAALVGYAGEVGR